MDAKLMALYPDVATVDGLGAAMTKAAEQRGCDIGPVGPVSGPVRIETDRGVISIGLAAEERLFLIGIHTPGFTWATGSTDDLGSAVEAVAAWREGTPLDDFEARFAFMRLDEFARPLAAGNPTPLQWSRLLSSDFHADQRNLLNRVHADERLRLLFPTVTHGVVRLRVDPLDGGSRQFLVQEVAQDRYRVETVGDTETACVTVPAADLVAYLRVLEEQQ
ncbi:hypothetical protein NFX46_33870 [Streptomyces phaeoluteigriseus]|uniref:Uncharacterized protein n=1 Tax=Streptomyces phaeoluteigriseus TaxID=114686 RepID=A0ABY4ZH54_9ACTN|nr:hypothetical protein [Streptomyces phaeoluteigriseus]USQ88301.1 hypothetical protein NFX46_33870 [Streptomyces phaeoluteigriseus]